MPGSTCRWNRAACAWSMRPGGSSGRPRCPVSPRRWFGSSASSAWIVTRIGLEAGPLSQWLHAGLRRAGFETVLLETRQVKAALSAMVVKTDRKDARGIAQLLRMGWFRPVHCKSPPAQEVRALLGRAQALAGQAVGRRAEHPRHLARFRAEGRGGEQGPIRGPHPRADRRPGDAGAGDRADAPGARGVARRVPRPAPGGAGHRPPRTRPAGG